MGLEVWLDTALAGRLTRDAQADRFVFDYDASWLARPDSYPLSPMLLMRSAARRARTPCRCAAFSRTCYPRGRALDDAVQALKISKSNLAGLLVGLGRETAGAIRLVVAGAPTSDRDEKRRVSTVEWSERIRQRAGQPFSVWDGKVRSSIAGY
ncbi:MAG: HipA N-terminal domain-containing protein [Acidiferrobacter thiooxydans]